MYTDWRSLEFFCLLFVLKACSHRGICKVFGIPWELLLLPLFDRSKDTTKPIARDLSHNVEDANLNYNDHIHKHLSFVDARKFASDAKSIFSE